jgi:hypothetical protein
MLDCVPDSYAFVDLRFHWTTNHAQIGFEVGLLPVELEFTFRPLPFEFLEEQI